ncbi:uridine kinase [Micromonospora sp. RP3T]|uniref:uridine kinase family protein n=1 Tax=Micromonospora sp. RP3T TaxID=2135446 RepID=UPI000D167299|nr:uridine kinase [Micromonospora sp. RP3T]PTA47096.1 uridine kinase [Micromonospora sp. RP3T]
MSDTAMLDIEELARVVAGSARGRPRVLVGIDGSGASGKSTLAAQLGEVLVGAAIVHVDDFYLPPEEHGSRGDAVGPLFDLPRLGRQVVRPAAAGEALRYQRYHWDIAALADWIDVPAEAPVIVEGVFCLAAELREAYSYTIFCRADPAVRLRRGLDRDGPEAKSQWVDEWMPAEDAYASAQAPEEFAQLVVDSTLGGDGVPRFHLVRGR